MFFIPTKVQLGHVKVNSIGRLSSFSVGENQKINNKNTSKKTEGFGEQNGDRTVVSIPIFYVNDDDIMDSDAVKQY
ncbi:MAG: hypothetical protein K0S25_1606 [Bacillus sp. (in: firmicutes)]|jgi:hypothetical protein|nr:hypothetical protein [Bacillus sp. (in: firmicutes)]